MKRPVLPLGRECYLALHIVASPPCRHRPATYVNEHDPAAARRLNTSEYQRGRSDLPPSQTYSQVSPCAAGARTIVAINSKKKRRLAEQTAASLSAQGPDLDCSVLAVMTTNNDPLTSDPLFRFRSRCGGKAFWFRQYAKLAFTISRIGSVDPIIEKCPEVIKRQRKKSAAVASRTQKTHRVAVKPLTRQRCDDDVLLGFRRRCWLETAGSQCDYLPNPDAGRSLPCCRNWCNAPQSAVCRWRPPAPTG
jgi:hypothetical protein